MKLYADIQRTGERLKISLWAEDEEDRAFRLTKLGRVEEDPEIMNRLEIQAHRALRILCIEEKTMPSLETAVLA